MDEVPNPGGVRRVEDGACAVDVQPLEVCRVAGGLEAPVRVHDCVGPGERVAQEKAAVRSGEVELDPSHPVVDVAPDWTAAGNAAHVVAIGEELVHDRRADVARRPRHRDDHEGDPPTSAVMATSSPRTCGSRCVRAERWNRSSPPREAR